MPDERDEVMQAQDLVALDLAARLRRLEDLPPRVNALESAVADIRRGLYEVVDNQKENHRETQQSLKDFQEQSQQRIDKSEEATRGAIDGLVKQVAGLARKVWFFAGAVWVLLGIGALAFAMRKELFTAALAAIGGPAQ